MFIVMHCMGLPFNGDTIKTKSLGGSETAAYYMAKELAVQGHEVFLFTNSKEEGVFDDVTYMYAGEPNDQNPLGNKFHYFASNIPHDVLIIQRHPAAFAFKWASKINLWWLHDLALIRNSDAINAVMWNIDGVLTVSEFHKQQVVEAYHLNPDIVFPIQNGIDLSLFEENNGREVRAHEIFRPLRSKEFKLLYTSRPERGLEHLVARNGIMERLAASCPEAHLYVCGYENTTQQIARYYDYLWQRCNELPNVTNLGALSKQQLADVMRQCDLLVYPTPGPMQPNFEEVSCITAMEAMAAGLPFLSSDKGALSETCHKAGAILLKLGKNGLPDVKKFTDKIVQLHGNDHALEAMKIAQLKAANEFSWNKAATMVQGHIETCFKRNRSNGAVMRHLMETSDAYALQEFIKQNGANTRIERVVEDELNECYEFAFKNTWKEHYERYYAYEKARGVEYGPEDVSNTLRFRTVADYIGGLNNCNVVLDYGCAHGHYTINLAKRYPEKSFVGVDITESNIRTARKWAEDEGLTNVRFIHGSFEDQDFSLEEHLINSCDPSDGFDAIIAAEVIEHVGDPRNYVDTLRGYLKPEGKMVITVPYGPWEAQGYKEHWPWRAHVWHFERQDIKDLWGHMDDFIILAAPAGRGKQGSVVGSYIVAFSNTASYASGHIDYSRKFDEIVPRQTISLCMIVRNAEATLKKSLDSVSEYVDEIVIALDNTTDDGTEQVIDKFVDDRKGLWPTVVVVPVESPLKTGFDSARNSSIEHATGDWILWMDSDEEMVHSFNLLQYPRNNQFNAYGLKQHHFAVEPLGVLKTDFPCRLFRNGKGIKFFGRVHEHPETELNKGAGHAQLVHNLDIAHNGYTTEAIRRKRFDRNIGLMERDRQDYPSRKLGKFLWIRDITQMIQYDLEQSGGAITSRMRAAAVEGITLWEELLEEGELRMLIEGLNFYSSLVKVLGGGFDAEFALSTSKNENGNMESKLITGHFASKEHLQKLMQKLLEQKVHDYDSPYY